MNVVVVCVLSVVGLVDNSIGWMMTCVRLPLCSVLSCPCAESLHGAHRIQLNNVQATVIK